MVCRTKGKKPLLLQRKEQLKKEIIAINERQDSSLISSESSRERASSQKTRLKY